MTVILKPIYWQFANEWRSVAMLSDKTAYSLTCFDKHPLDGDHTIECLWIWHDCDMNLLLEGQGDEVKKRVEDVKGWKPTGIAKHDLLNIEPLHIEPSIYWPSCCGMHGFIRDGKWEDA